MAALCKAIGQVKRFLNKNELKYVVCEEQSLRGMFGGDNGQWNWLVRPTPDEKFVMFYGCSPTRIPPGSCAAVAEYLTRANWGLRYGAFEMNWADGAVRFRTSLAVMASGLHEDGIANLVFANLSVMDQYLPGLLAVAYGHADPEQAVADVEGDPRAAALPDRDPPADAAQDSNGHAPPIRLDGFITGSN